MRRLFIRTRFLWVVVLTMLAGAWPVVAQAAGPADPFAVLAGSALTCTDSTVAGQVGIASAFAVASTRCNMQVSVNNGAYSDFTTRYGVIAGTLGCPLDHILTGTLAGQTLLPGTYCFSAAAALTGTLHLNG